MENELIIAQLKNVIVGQSLTIENLKCENRMYCDNWQKSEARNTETEKRNKKLEKTFRDMNKEVIK